MISADLLVVLPELTLSVIAMLALLGGVQAIPSATGKGGGPMEGTSTFM